MMKPIALTERDVKMLELLAQGEPSKEIARKLGYRAGTMRVYLHDLYRKLHVSNKTAAVVWYFDNFRAPPTPQPREQAGDGSLAGLEETVGDMAVRTDLFTALGAMSTLVGPYGKLWQVAARLKGTRLEGEAERARRGRALWEALLRGDFAAGKKRYDHDHAAHFTGRGVARARAAGRPAAPGRLHQRGRPHDRARAAPGQARSRHPDGRRARIPFVAAHAHRVPPA